MTVQPLMPVLSAATMAVGRVSAAVSSARVLRWLMNDRIPFPSLSGVSAVLIIKR